MFSMIVSWPKEYQAFANSTGIPVIDLLLPVIKERTGYQGFKSEPETSPLRIRVFNESDIKWNDYEEDLVAISKEFPELLFEMDRQGEGSDDSEEIVVKDGEYASSFREMIFWGDKESREKRDRIINKKVHCSPIKFLER